MAAEEQLDMLKKGLINFSNQNKDRRDQLLARLSQNETISPADEQWLDYESNTVGYTCKNP
ncbi:hypothetical protein BJV74DRAFT_851745 [Russula compacta]|nr:hypothetical protein BJV74DRAFT_851745 [Russula compacta]